MDNPSRERGRKLDQSMYPFMRIPEPYPSGRRFQPVLLAKLPFHVFKASLITDIRIADIRFDQNFQNSSASNHLYTMSSTPYSPYLICRSSSYRLPTPSSKSTTPFFSTTDADNLFSPDRPPETPHLSNTFILGTRKSNLALIQTHLVVSSLSDFHPFLEFLVESLTTVGDRNQITPLQLLTPYSQQQPAKSLWTDELEARLTNGHFDLLVHSLKDVPTSLKEGCEIGAMLKREDPRDCLVVKAGEEERFRSLEDLPEGSVVGTGSVRRVAQLKRRFPGLRFEDMVG